MIVYETNKCSTPTCVNERSAGRTICGECRYARAKKPRAPCVSDECTRKSMEDSEHCQQCARDIRSKALIEELGLTGEKYCKFCGEDKKLECFSKNRQAPDGLTTKCKECVAEYNRVRNPPKKTKSNDSYEYLGKGRGPEAYLSKPWAKMAETGEMAETA